MKTTTNLAGLILQELQRLTNSPHYDGSDEAVEAERAIVWAASTIGYNVSDDSEAMKYCLKATSIEIWRYWLTNILPTVTERLSVPYVAEDLRGWLDDEGYITESRVRRHLQAVGLPALLLNDSIQALADSYPTGIFKVEWDSHVEYHTSSSLWAKFGPDTTSNMFDRSAWLSEHGETREGLSDVLDNATMGENWSCDNCTIKRIGGEQ